MLKVLLLIISIFYTFHYINYNSSEATAKTIKSNILVSDSDISRLLNEFMQKAVSALKTFKDLLTNLFKQMPDQSSQKSLNYLQRCPH